eukprot:TRINITY_DN11424_c0_g1_i1.p1 TRINITY_DN11424_c0_g1~~TRINITY_DN11424_c0_g1_i1.p1  ORF type:complete len:118 (-),score=58.80 TRINITY_DN11424_c0_g1_i1:9-362(-)
MCIRDSTEVDDWLEQTEADEFSYVSDDDGASHPGDFRRILAEKDRQIKLLRGQLRTAKQIVKRNKAINQETNKELTDVLQEILTLRDENKQLEMTLEVFKNQTEQAAKKTSSAAKGR